MHGWSCQSQPQVQNNVTWHLSTVQFGSLTFHFLRGPTLVARSPDYYSFHVRSVCQWHIWKLSPTDCGHVAKSGTPALLTLQSCECEMMVYRWLACLPLQQWTGLLLSGVGGSSDQAIKCACFVLAAHPCQRLTAHAHSLLINSSQGNWPQASPDLGHFGSRSCLANCRYCCCWWCCSHLRATLTHHIELTQLASPQPRPVAVPWHTVTTRYTILQQLNALPVNCLQRVMMACVPQPRSPLNMHGLFLRMLSIDILLIFRMYSVFQLYDQCNLYLKYSLARHVFIARCYASVVLAMALCLSVCPSQVGVLLKRLNIRSHKQHHAIAQGL